MGKKDVPILLLFFTREKPLRMVFEQVREYRPKKIYLFQDGPRNDRPDDLKKILECRKMVESMIDWECEVHRQYCEENLGCDPAEYASVSWVLENEDCVIRLEDDNVASQSFFPYCEELLERYKNDKRIFMITGRNQLGTTNYNNGLDSYFFSEVDSIWGFATWKDRWSMLDPCHSFLTNESVVSMLVAASHNRYEINRWLDQCRRHREQTLRENKVASYESAIRAAMLLHHMLCVVPQHNMIKSAGACEEGEHTVGDVNLMLKKDRILYEMEAQEVAFPLKHPDMMINNVDFYERRNKLLYWDSAFHRNLHLVQLGLNNRLNKLKGK